MVNRILGQGYLGNSRCPGIGRGGRNPGKDGTEAASRLKLIIAAKTAMLFLLLKTLAIRIAIRIKILLSSKTKCASISEMSISTSSKNADVRKGKAPAQTQGLTG